MARKSRDMALCGCLCALAVVIMSLGTLIPMATYCCPVLASFVLLPVMLVCGKKLSWVLYGAIAILSVLLAPDKEAAAIFVALGYYPIVKPWFDAKKRLLRVLGKALLFNLSAVGVCAVLLFVLQMDALRQEFSAMNAALLVSLLAGGNLVFWMDDLLLARLLPLVRQKLEHWRKKI